MSEDGNREVGGRVTDEKLYNDHPGEWERKMTRGKQCACLEELTGQIRLGFTGTKQHASTFSSSHVCLFRWKHGIEDVGQCAVFSRVGSIIKGHKGKGTEVYSRETNYMMTHGIPK